VSPVRLLSSAFVLSSLEMVSPPTFSILVDVALTSSSLAFVSSSLAFVSSLSALSSPVASPSVAFVT